MVEYLRRRKGSGVDVPAAPENRRQSVRVTVIRRQIPLRLFPPMTTKIRYACRCGAVNSGSDTQKGFTVILGYEDRCGVDASAAGHLHRRPDVGVHQPDRTCDYP